MTGQKSSGVYITSIQSGAWLRARAKPVVVVVVRTQAESRLALLHRRRELQRDQHFTDADRVHPGVTTA